jgi:transcriptional regulator with XRE-family HTH domain
VETKEKTLIVDGQRLKALRKEKKIKIPVILNYVGVARSTYTNWEQGHRTPGAENLNKLAEILETSTDYLLRKTDDPSTTSAKNNGGFEWYLQESTIEYNGIVIDGEKKKQLANMIDLFFKATENEK